MNGDAIDDVPNKVTPEQVTVPSFLEDLPPIREEVARTTTPCSGSTSASAKRWRRCRPRGRWTAPSCCSSPITACRSPCPRPPATTTAHWCPATIRWPGMGEPKVIEQMTQSIDIMPTLLDVLGIHKPDMDGRSWMPLIRGEKQDNRDYIINNVNGVANGNRDPCGSSNRKERADRHVMEQRKNRVPRHRLHGRPLASRPWRRRPRPIPKSRSASTST